MHTIISSPFNLPFCPPLNYRTIYPTSYLQNLPSENLIFAQINNPHYLISLQDCKQFSSTTLFALHEKLKKIPTCSCSDSHLYEHLPLFPPKATNSCNCLLPPPAFTVTASSTFKRSPQPFENELPLSSFLCSQFGSLVWMKWKILTSFPLLP